MTLSFKLIDSIDAVDAMDWNACAGGHPFAQHAFFHALEASGALGPKRGVVPRYALLTDTTHGLVACAPAMLKWGGLREYGPEIRWLKAGLQAGCFAWPKFQVGVPFFPVMGPKLLIRPDQAQEVLRSALLKCLLQLGRGAGDQSVFNVLHVNEPHASVCRSHGAMLAAEWHAMWFNQGFASRDDYLSTASKHARENFRRDRQLALSHGLEFKTLRGHELNDEVLAEYYEGHRRVCARYAMQPWLPAAAYAAIARALPQAAMLMGYFKGPRLMAGVMHLYAQAEQTLYALQWSEMDKLDGIAMDLICHRPIDHAIENGLAKLDSGLVAPHKQHRGWQTVPVHHAHWFYSDDLKALAVRELGSRHDAGGVDPLTAGRHHPLVRSQVATAGLLTPLGRSDGCVEPRDRVSMARVPMSMGVFNLGFKRPADVRPDALGAWLGVLDDQLLADAVQDRARGQAHDDQIWLRHVLALACGLFHVLRVPWFDPIEVLQCDPPAEANGNWQGVCRLPDPLLVSAPVLVGVVKAAFKLAAWACRADVESLADREYFFQTIDKDVLNAFPAVKPKGKSTFEVLKVAHRLGIPSVALPGGIFQLGWGSQARRIDRSTTDQDSAMGLRWTHDKRLTAQLLRAAGLPGPVHTDVNALAPAKEAAERMGYPVVVKPADLERGEGVSVDVQADGLAAAFDEALRRSPTKAVLIEQQVPGVCHRLFVAAGQLLYAVRRLPMGVYADGHSTIGDLVALQCEAQQRIAPWKRSGIRPLDALALQVLQRQGWEPTSVPESGQFIALRRIETTAWGGVDEEVTHTIHPENVSAAVAAARLFGLEVAGVDLISQDIRLPWHVNGAIINEVNFAPLLGGAEISRRYVGKYLGQLLKGSGRIPVEVFVGGAAALEAAKARQVEWGGAGRCAWLSTGVLTLAPNAMPPSAGSPAGGQRWHAVAMPLRGLHDRARALLLSRDVQVLLLVVQDDELLRTGAPLDWVDEVHVIDADLVEAGTERPGPLPSPRADELMRFLRAWARRVRA